MFFYHFVGFLLKISIITSSSWIKTLNIDELSHINAAFSWQWRLFSNPQVPAFISSTNNIDQTEGFGFAMVTNLKDLVSSLKSGVIFESFIKLAYSVHF